MENSEKRTEELMEELTKKNKKLLYGSYALVTVSVLFYLFSVFVASFVAEKSESAVKLIVFVPVLILFAGLFVAFRMEIDAGYYECKNCRHKFVPTYKAAMLAAHTPKKRYLKCPECSTKTWAKKVMSKE